MYQKGDISGLIGKLNRTGGTTGGIGLDKIIAAATPENNCEGVLKLILMITSLNNHSGMGFDGIVITVPVRDFLFDGIKTGTAGWMIGLRKDQPQKNVLFITDRLPITVFGSETGFALFNHKNDTMENEWYEVRVSKEKGIEFETELS